MTRCTDCNEVINLRNTKGHNHQSVKPRCGICYLKMRAKKRESN